MTTNAELKRLAEQATPGEWSWVDGASPSDMGALISADGKRVCWFGDFGNDECSYPAAGDSPSDDDQAFLAAANPARIITLVDECEKHERTIARLSKQASTSRTFWLRAARAALDGDLRELRNRVDMADAPPVDVVLSLVTGEGE